MKLTIVIFFAVFLQVSAAGFAQKISIATSNASAEEVFNIIRKQSGYSFVYSPQMVKSAHKVSLSFSNADIDEVLTAFFKDQPLTYTIMMKTVAVKWKAPVAPLTPPIKIIGKVTDNNAVPLAGVSIQVKGANTTTVTNAEGSFTINVPNENSVLVITYIGFKSQEIAIGNRRDIQLSLVEEPQSLNQVVVVGYGAQKKATVTGAIATVTTKELLQTPQANISNMLVGRLPGLIAVQRSGEPGQNQSTLRIRGTGTFNGNADPLIMVDGIERPDFNAIDPNEIESLSILKDASSTAIYGVRGANGVVLITTRQGKKGAAPSINYTGNVAGQSPTLLPSYLNSYDYARLLNEATKNDTYITGSPYVPAFSDADVELYRNGSDPLFHPNIDWMETFLRDMSLQTQHNVNINGGTENTQYFISAGYFDQQGIYKYTDLDPEFSTNARNARFNFRSNLDFTITKRFSASIKIAGQNENRNYPGNSASDIWRDISWTNPLSTPGLIDGKVVRIDGQAAAVNPFWSLLSAGFNQQFRSNLNTSVKLTHNLDFLVKGLSIHGTVAYDSYYSQAINRSKGITYYLLMKDASGGPIYLPQGEETPLGYAETIDKNRRIYAESALNYTTKIGRSNITGLLLYNQTKYYSPSLQYLVPNGYQGLVSRVAYNFAGKYLAEVNLGYNGTENFARGRRFGLFPAFSMGWVASEEKFFPKNGTVSFLKIRGSYGEVGNDKINGERFLYLPSAYSYLANAEGSRYYFGTVGQNYNPYIASVESKIGNPFLTWERAKKSNIGLELNMFNSKLTFVGDVFTELRDNILANRGTIPNLVGATLPAYNLGVMRNQGWEAELGFSDHFKEFNYWAKANYTYAHNKILFQDEAPKTYAYQNSTGNRMSQHFGLLSDGLYNTWEEVNDPKRPVSTYSNNKVQPGDIRYVDYNEDGKIDQDDRVPIGYSPIPEKIFGFSLGAGYKGLDFSALFQGAANVSINYFGRALWPFTKGQESAKENILERWTEERYKNGEPISFPRLGVNPSRSSDHNYQESDYWIRNANYVRFKNMEIGYTISKKSLEKIRIKAVRVYVNGSNLITWSDAKQFDPESPTAGGNTEITAYPLQKTYNFGFNVKF